ncbi:murein L,D-transpeptidase catalytic domain family protein [Pontibacter silvestris]|uniref:Murein L,D-transpeptidase catalytic domain family protein n=1 Tax=Pontibacter silvestris TaxID=2305183 RepID=A0ABW4WV01_9BACT|nr:murein L,D-transpeptidase catalytic domain family protein [Pontibacter silvestris]MCC9137992.1 murein L,D-transpeptidase catalytic domain family protein [Pontibacter silvestris]
MLRAVLSTLTLGLLSFSFTLPADGVHADVLPSTAVKAPVITTPVTSTMPDRLTFAEKQAAFNDHVLDIYNSADLQRKGLSFDVFQKALIGFHNFKKNNLISPSKSVITVVDFTKSSSQKRLWTIDLHSKKVLFNTLVAHGRNTGGDKAVKFSNQPNSFMSSVGFYLTNQTYYGKHGLSLRLSGMDDKYNSNALPRAIVIHGADYVSEAFVKRNGRLGRSLGCPALPQEVSKDVINAIKDKTVLYIHGAEKNYTSNYLNPATAVDAFALETLSSTVSKI